MMTNELCVTNDEGIGSTVVQLQRTLCDNRIALEAICVIIPHRERLESLRHGQPSLCRTM